MKYTFKKERNNVRNYKLMAEMWEYNVPFKITQWIFSKKPAHKAMDSIVEEYYLNYQKKKKSILSRIFYAVV